MAVIALHPAARPKHGLLEYPVVYAPHPHTEGEYVALAISESTVQKLAAAQRRTTLFEAWGHLVGEMPPVNNATHYLRHKHPGCELTTLADASACFQGVKRPYGTEDNGSDVYVFVINSQYTVRWSPDMACVADVTPVPDDTVMTVQVRASTALQPSVAGVWGTITKWEFVRACPEQPALPFDHADRYANLLWSR